MSAAWYRNGDQIADFLTEANPDNWPREEMRAMMRTHLDQTLAEATQRLEGHMRPRSAPTTRSTTTSSRWPTC
jgi:hypothetical protein